MTCERGERGREERHRRGGGGGSRRSAALCRPSSSENMKKFWKWAGGSSSDAERRESGSGGNTPSPASQTGYVQGDPAAGHYGTLADGPSDLEQHQGLPSDPYHQHYSQAILHHRRTASRDSYDSFTNERFYGSTPTQNETFLVSFSTPHCLPLPLPLQD